MDEEQGPNKPFDFSAAMPRSWINKETENKKVNRMTYFFSFIIWVPIVVTVFKFWWDFGIWLFQ